MPLLFASNKVGGGGYDAEAQASWSPLGYGPGIHNNLMFNHIYDFV